MDDIKKIALVISEDPDVMCEDEEKLLPLALDWVMVPEPVMKYFRNMPKPRRKMIFGMLKRGDEAKREEIIGQITQWVTMHSTMSAARSLAPESQDLTL